MAIFKSRNPPPKKGWGNGKNLLDIGETEAYVHSRAAKLCNLSLSRREKYPKLILHTRKRPDTHPRQFRS